MMKYIHGWLATKRQWYRQGAFKCATCFFCTDEEDSFHVFSCKHVAHREQQQVELAKVTTALESTSPPEVI